MQRPVGDGGKSVRCFECTQVLQHGDMSKTELGPLLILGGKL